MAGSDDPRSGRQPLALPWRPVPGQCDFLAPAARVGPPYAPAGGQCAVPQTDVVARPRRVQRRRTPGARMAVGTVYVGRPSKWGNPYRVGAVSAAAAVERYRVDLLAGRLAVSADDVRADLRGRDLACWCAVGQPCHGDVLLEVANRSV